MSREISTSSIKHQTARLSCVPFAVKGLELLTSMRVCTLQHPLQSRVPGNACEHRLRRGKRAGIGAAVKYGSDGQERPPALGAAREAAKPRKPIRPLPQKSRLNISFRRFFVCYFLGAWSVGGRLILSYSVSFPIRRHPAATFPSAASSF